MDYKIELRGRWRYRHHKRGLCEIPAGLYAVPEQLTDRAARLAIEQGMARRINIVQPMPIMPAQLPEKRKRGRPRKGPAPENKSLGRAPDNKQVVV